MSGASEQANGRASGPILQSVFLVVLDHSGGVKSSNERNEEEKEKGSTAGHIRCDFIVTHSFIIYDIK